MNYTEIFTAYLEPKIDAAVRSMNYDLAYNANPPVATIIFDGSQYAPYFRASFTEKQDAKYMATEEGPDHDAYMDWVIVIGKMSDALDIDGPEGETYVLDEDEGCLYLVRLDAEGNVPAGYAL